MTNKYTIEYIDDLMNSGDIAAMSFSARIDTVKLMNQAYEEGFKGGVKHLDLLRMGKFNND